MNNTETIENSKVLYIYVAKCLATIMVLFNHTYIYWGPWQMNLV